MTSHSRKQSLALLEMSAHGENTTGSGILGFHVYGHLRFFPVCFSFLEDWHFDF